MNTNKFRIGWIDIAKGFLVCFVVLGHIISDNENLLQIWIYSFHVPGFFIINGVLKNQSNFFNKYSKYSDLIRKQTKLIKYYIVFSLIFLLRFYVQFLLGMYSFNDVLIFIEHIFLLVGEGVLWFLPVFLLSEYLFKFIFDKSIFVKSLLVVISLGIITYVDFSSCNIQQVYNPLILIFTLVSRVLVATLFVLIGFYFNKYILQSNRYILIILLSMGTLICFDNGNVDLNLLRFNNPFKYIVAAVSGTSTIILLSIIISKYHGILSSLISWYGKNSLIVFITHAIFLVFQLSKMLVSMFVSTTTLEIVFSFILCMIVEAVIVLLMNSIENRFIKLKK